MRTTWLRRGEWNFFLLASLCALLAASPSAGASLAASSLAASSLAVSSLTTVAAPQQYKAVLWWLQQHTPPASLGATAQPPEVQPVADLMARLQDSLPVAHHTGIELPRQLSSGHTVALSDEFAPVAPILAPVYDASRRLAAHSLTSHEATMLCGIRTNRSIE